jgi:excisionase family DNA binding protein
VSRRADSDATYTVTEAAALLGIHRETAYLAIAADRFPVPVIRMGRAIKVPRALLDAALGLGAAEPAGQAGPPADAEAAGAV